MFIGHFGVGFAAKRWAPAISLGSLFLACQLADLVWPVLVLTGVEVARVDPGATAVTPIDFVSYPYSHSLVALALWGIAFGTATVILQRTSTRVGVVVAATVVSHWVLDVASHRADVPLAIGGGPRLGLGLWRSVPATLLVEGTLFAIGVAVYLLATRARDRTGKLALAGLVGFLVVVYLANLFGPPPPDIEAVAWSALAMWLLVAWGYWVDAHREPIGEESRQ